MAKTQAAQKDPDNAQIARMKQLAEPPIPVLMRKTSHVVTSGDRVLRPNLKDGSIWHVITLSTNGFRALVTDHKYGMLEGIVRRDDCVKEWVPVDCLVPYVPGMQRKPDQPKPEAPAPDKPLRAKTPTKIVPPKDDLAFKLAQADTLDELWKLAIKLGLPADLRPKLAHLNPGLQRMNIGNRLRKLGVK